MTTKLAGALALILSGFLLGTVVSQDKGKANVPTTRRHALKPITQAGNRVGQDTNKGEFPAMDEWTENGLRNLPYMKGVDHFQKDGTGWRASVRFKNTEEWWMQWIDRWERDAWSTLDMYDDKLSRFSDGQLVDLNPGILFLPPADQDASKLTWVVERHANGYVKRVTPYTGEVRTGKGRAHGIQLEYNNKGGLTAMTPFKSGRKHGTALTFNGRTPSRRQESTGAREWSNGRPVMDKTPGKQRPPGMKRPPRKKGK